MLTSVVVGGKGQSQKEVLNHQQVAERPSDIHLAVLLLTIQKELFAWEMYC